MSLLSSMPVATDKIAGGSVVSDGIVSDGIVSDSVVSDKDERRRELSAFLRSRRERIQPEEVGFAPGGRRRTPGLRREEVAQLAGVGVTWYTWLEQGRDINVSAQVLEAISRTLRLDRLERNHLYTLAGIALGPGKSDCSALPGSVQKMLGQLSPYPALVLNSRYDVLAFNDSYCKVILDLDAVPLEERNLLWLTFVSDEWQCSFVDGEAVEQHLVAGYRAASAEHLSEPSWQDLTERLLASSPLFAELWQRYDVAAPSSKIKVLGNERVGILRMESVSLWVSQVARMRMITYTPVDEETESKLHTLVNC
ncbi:helix-turn-helix transcriptional regulator [Streptomyces sp. SID13031]|uniref:helix-turn-helix transcriptional regulator n=1 Tax=Streptomyces sp. SID13031 TaxID=2706046 RepID=UPI0031BA7BC2